MIDEQKPEERPEVGDRVTKRRHGRARVAVLEQHDRPIEEAGAEPDCAGEVEPAAHTNAEGQQTRRDQDQRIEEDVQTRVLVTMRNGQHRNVHRRVLFLAVECQRPKMWWRPSEDNQHQEQPTRFNRSGNRRPPKQGWCCGELAELAKFAQQVHVVFAKVPDNRFLSGTGGAEGGFTVDHSGNIVVIDPRGNYHGFIKMPHKVDTLLAVFRYLRSTR